MFAASRIVFIRFFFFFNDTATTEIYTLSLHDALPITSRPLLLYAVGRQIRHANQTIIKITSTHGKAGRVRRMLAEVAAFFKSLRPTAEQLTDLERWYRILSRALVKYLKGRQLEPPPAQLPA